MEGLLLVGGITMTDQTGQLRGELVALRERRGVSVERMAQVGSAIMAHPAVDEELVRLDLADVDRPMAAVSVVECLVRSDGWHPKSRLVLLKTLNFETDPGMLDSRRIDLMLALNMRDTAYRNFEEEVYRKLAYRLATTRRSPCLGPQQDQLSEMLARMNLDQAITLAGAGDDETGVKRVRRYLEERVPAALAAFSGSSSESFSAADELAHPVRHAVNNMIGVLSIVAYDRALNEYEKVLGERLSVIPRRMLRRIVDLYAQPEGAEAAMLALAREVEQGSGSKYRASLGRGAGPYVFMGAPTFTFTTVLDNTLMVVDRLIAGAEAANSWQALIREARVAQDKMRGELARRAQRLHEGESFELQVKRAAFIGAESAWFADLF